MKKIIESILIKILKLINTDLLSHAHVQIGVGHNAYISGEDYVIDKALPELLKIEPTVIFDVGANIGDYSKSLRGRFPNAAIYCFEPVPDTFNVLKENTKDHNLTYNPIGLSSNAEDIDLYIGDNNSDGSMATAYPECLETIFTFTGDTQKVVTCKFMRLDDYCQENGIRNIDFLKIDVEGHEYEVLKGAESMLKGNHISVVQFEFNEFNIASKHFMKNFYDILPQYSFYRIMPKNELYPMGEYNSSLEIFRYQNILAVNKHIQ